MSEPLTKLSVKQQTIRELSDRLVEAQRPLRILDAVKWDDSVRERFFRSGCMELPEVDQAYYAARPLPFGGLEKRREFLDLELEIKRRLGDYSPVGVIMRRRCREYETAIRMLEARGTPDFARLSQELYGSAQDVFYDGEPTLADFGAMMAGALEQVGQSATLQPEPKTIPAPEAVRILQERLALSMPHPRQRVEVRLSDGIVADAAAGSDYIKLRGDAYFNERDLRLLEVHEGWVHVGTTLNGACQPICTFLSKGTPSSTTTQEGLAILVENLSFATHTERLRRVSNRIRAVAMVEQGADFLDVFRFGRQEGMSDEDAYASAARVFRGSTPDGLPFTKDVSYSKGFILIYNYIQMAVRSGKLSRIPLLFCGKTALDDLRTLNHLVDDGLVAPPAYLPAQIADLQALTAWMCYSSFIRTLSLDRIQAEYANIL